MVDFEQQFAVALKKAQQETKRQSQVPLSVQKKQLIEEIKYYKRRILEACEIKDQKKAEKNLDSLLKNLAKMTALNLQKIQEGTGDVSQTKLKEEISKFYTSAITTIRMVKFLMTNYG